MKKLQNLITNLTGATAVVTTYLSMDSQDRSLTNYLVLKAMRAHVAHIRCVLIDALRGYPKLLPLWIMIISLGAYAGFYVLPAISCLALLMMIHWYLNKDNVIWRMSANEYKDAYSFSLCVIRGKMKL